MPAGVLVQHHPRHRAARTLAAVRAPHARQVQQPAPLQQRLGPRVAPPKAALNQVLVDVPGREPRNLVPVEALARVRLRVRNPVVRHRPKPAVPKPRLALITKPPAPATKGPLAHPQQLRRFHLAQLAAVATLTDLAKPQHPDALKHLQPAHPTLLAESHILTGQIECCLQAPTQSLDN